MKKIAFTLLLLSVSAATMGGGALLSKTVVAAAEPDLPKNGPVETVQTDYYERQIKLDVEYQDGVYYLCDYTRNIYIHNGRDVRSEMEMHTSPDEFPIYTSTDGKFDDKTAVSVFYNLRQAYDYYTEANIGIDWKGVNGKNDDVHGNLSSKRGTEMPIHVFIHMNVGAFKYNAAYSHMQNKDFCIVFLGDGDESGSLYHQGAALDVLAHEYQHGVTEFYSNGLDYNGESGALNEAFSDIFGILIEGKEKDISPDQLDFWIVGENGVPGYQRYIRNIHHPDKGFAETYSGRYQCMDPSHRRQHDVTCDYGGVHTNSTVITHIQYMACKNLPGYFTNERIAKLWLRTLYLLPHNADFIDFAKCYRSAAADLNFSEEAQRAISLALSMSGFPTFYKVTFQNEDGTVLGASYVSQGENARAPENPTKQHTEHFRYEFTGWDLDFKNVQSDLVITASYREIPIFLVRFLDGNGEIFDEQVIDIGERATVPKQSPVKDAAAGKRFEFDHWDYDFGAVTKNIEVTPVFRDINIYTVKFFDAKNALIKEETVDEGAGATAPSDTPVKERDETKRYVFSGWDQPFDEIHENLEIRPEFDGINIYSIQFFDENGDPLTEEYIVDEGESVEAPLPPKKPSTEQFSYTFLGWDGEYENVHKSAVISPRYETTTKTYSVQYYLDGELSDSSPAEYGSSFSEPPKGYEGWYADPECTTRFLGNSVTGPITLYAKNKHPHLGLFIGLGVGAAAVILGAGVAIFFCRKSRNSSATKK